MARSARGVEGGRKARHAYDARVVPRDGPGAAGAGGEARHSAPLWRRYERHLGIAGALSEPRRAPAVAAARSSAVSRRLRFPAVALREPRDRRRAGGVVGEVPACGRADACRHADQRHRRCEQEAAPAPAQEKARCGGHRIRRLMTPVTAYIALGANLEDPVVQVRAGLAALATLPDTQLLMQSSLYRTAP